MIFIHSSPSSCLPTKRGNFGSHFIKVYLYTRISNMTEMTSEQKRDTTTVPTAISEKPRKHKGSLPRKVVVPILASVAVGLSGLSCALPSAPAPDTQYL